MNIALCWMSPPRRTSTYSCSPSVSDVRGTWLYRTSQEERDGSLLCGTVYHSRISDQIGTPLPITFGTRATFGRMVR